MSEDFVPSFSESRRLKVFEAITEAQETLCSRVVSARLGDRGEDGYGAFRAFGAMVSCGERDKGEVVAHYYDLRHAKQAYNYLLSTTNVCFYPDESSDSLVLTLRDYLSTPSLDSLLPSFGDIATSHSIGLYYVTQYYDLRVAPVAASELSKLGLSPVVSAYSRFEQSEAVEAPAFENSFYGVQLQAGELDVSIDSERTLASSYVGQCSSSYSGDSSSPYIESPQDDSHRRKPRKKPMDDKDKALYELSIPRILDGTDVRTTVMVKNIPNKYTQKMLLSAIDRHFSGTYDFFYLPIDFKNKCNVGYAFVNFLDPTTIPAFYSEKHGKKWEHFKSEKICAIAYARIQGKTALIQHFQSSSVMSQEDQKVKPLILMGGQAH